MKIGIILSTADPEIVWNALRFANTGLQAQHNVKIFLINKGVEVEDINNKKYDIKEQIKKIVENNGKMLACGTCLKSRQKEGSNVCPLSTMKDLLKLVEESDKVLTFG